MHPNPETAGDALRLICFPLWSLGLLRCSACCLPVVYSAWPQPQPKLQFPSWVLPSPASP